MKCNAKCHYCKNSNLYGDELRCSIEPECDYDLDDYFKELPDVVEGGEEVEPVD